MLGYVAALLFFIAFLLVATSTATSEAVFSPTSLMLVGLACLALHLSGVGTGWSPRGRTRR
jgi:cell shape-determining protein MreD